MANRGGRAALERLQARMTEEVTVEDEAEPVAVSLDGEGDNEPDGGGGVIDDPVDDDGPSIDYSHAGDDESEAEPDPEPEPRDRSDRRPAANDDAVEALAAQLAELRGEIAANKQAEAAEAQLVDDLQHVRRAAGLSQRNLQEAQAAYAKHAAAGEWGKAAQAQADMAAAVADLREYQAAEAELVQEMRQPRRQQSTERQPAQQQPPQQQGDAFEQAISRFSAPQQEWLRKNRDDLTKSESRGKKAEAAHHEAIEAGHKLNSPAYFAHLDKVMGYGVTTTKTTKPAPGKPQRAAPTAGGSSAARGSVTEVKLSRDEVNTAKQLGMTAKAYAAQKARLIENGRDPSKSGPRYSRESHHVRR